MINPMFHDETSPKQHFSIVLNEAELVILKTAMNLLVAAKLRDISRSERALHIADIIPTTELIKAVQKINLAFDLLEPK